MQRAHKALRQAGLSLVDVLVGLGIAAVVALISATYTATATEHARRNQDHVFAFAKAQAILEEIRAEAESGATDDASELDRFDDAGRWSFTLTLQTEVVGGATVPVAADSAASGNRFEGGGWRYARQISVRPFTGIDTRDLRIVTVRVFRYDEDDPPGAQIANLSTVVRTLSEAYPPTQVFDVYLLALENVPGWWVNLGSLKPFVEASLRDVMARNPGLELRTHWITKTSFGRDPEYTPYFNETHVSTDATPYAYFYPGRMPAGSATEFYYVPERVQGRANVDGVVRNGFDATLNPLPYSLADQFNHSMRYPDELALFDARVAAGLEDPDVPTWRIFLERLNTDPDRYRNAILINLHGELLPMPPLRNYSDAAREPATRPNVRVVTHPEKLRFTRDDANPANSDDVRLRVYTYKTDPSSGPETLDAPVIVEIPGLDLTGSVNAVSGSATVRIGCVRGGTDLDPVDGARDDYEPLDNAPVVVGTGPYTPSFANEMYARVRYEPPVGGVPGATVFELHNSPLVTPLVNNRGLASGARLYGMEYIPCSVESANSFSNDLYALGTVPKNTARWVIVIPRDQLGSSDTRLTITTRIGSGSGGDTTSDDAAFATGVMYPPTSRNEPQNISRTYTWWAASREAVPYTERYQFQGDPRHCPYADLKSGGSSFPDGTNWYFDDFQNGSTNAIGSWPGFSASRLKNNGNTSDDGWKGRIEIDVPRFFQVLRAGLVESETLYTSMTGWSYYYMGVGNEIGYDSANGYANSIPVAGDPFGAPGATGYEQSITNAAATWGTGVKLVRSNASGTYWWCKPWIGELCPDSAYPGSWRVPLYEYSDTLPVPNPLPAPKGNLPAGSASSEFRRVARDAITVGLPAGTTLRQAQRRTQQEGCTSFFNTGTSSATFHHQGRDGTTGNLTAVGVEVSEDFRMPLPGTTPISRPFSIAASGDGGTGDEFGFTTDYPRYGVQQLDMYFNHSGGTTGSALLQVTNPTGTRTGYQLVHGIDRTLASGSAFIARYSIATLVHGYFRAGDPARTRPMALSARVQVLAPTAVTQLVDPATITVQWRTAWQRWDGKDYSRTQSSPLSEPENNLEYRLIYSPDSGTTWFHCADGSPAVPGKRPTAGGLLATDANPAADESATWPTPTAGFPEGSYLLRVECWRRNSSLHLSYHQERIFIER